MELKACPQCGSEMSVDARYCEQCAMPVGPQRKGRVSGFEWKSKAAIFRIPLIHVAFGWDTQGKLRVAKGVIAVGQFAVGLITIAQFGVGVLFALGQLVCGLGVAGQIAAGFVAIGQVAAGMYGLCQVGWAKYMWSPDRVDLEAVALFCTIKLGIFQLLGLE